MFRQKLRRFMVLLRSSTSWDFEKRLKAANQKKYTPSFAVFFLPLHGRPIL